MSGSSLVKPRNLSISVPSRAHTDSTVRSLVDRTGHVTGGLVRPVTARRQVGSILPTHEAPRREVHDPDWRLDRRRLPRAGGGDPMGSIAARPALARRRAIRRPSTEVEAASTVADENARPRSTRVPARAPS